MAQGPDHRIVVPVVERNDPTEIWQGLFTRPVDFHRARAAVTRAVEDSFRTHPMRNVTRREVTRRTRFCMEAVARQVRDQRWSLVRALDLIVETLRRDLDGRAADEHVGPGGWAVPDSARVLERPKEGAGN